MIVAQCHTAIDSPWREMTPVRVGRVPVNLPTPDLYVLVSNDGKPRLRADVYCDRSNESLEFIDTIVWGPFVAIGLGNRTFFIRLNDKHATTFELETYFARFYPCESWLLVASAERLFRIEPDGTLAWRSEQVGIDGVLVHQMGDRTIEGEGEWDPPGGWRPFSIATESGKLIQ